MEIETTPVVIGALAITSLEFEYLHRKSRCDMLIGGDDISNEVITLGTCFSIFVYIRACFRVARVVCLLRSLFVYASSRERLRKR